MIDHILSVQGLAFVLPFLFSAILYTGAQYGHLNFKHVSIRKISMIAGLLSLPVVVFLLPLVIDLAFVLELRLLSIHALFLGICFLCVLCIYIASPKRLPNLIQLAGIGIFMAGFYYILA